MIAIYTSIYNEKNEQRKAEIIECLRKNTKSSFIDEIYLFVEGEAFLDVSSKKIRQQRIGWRPKYNDYFDLAANHQVTHSDLVLIANSDIYFDENINSLCHALKPNQCAALSRWNIKPSSAPVLLDRNDSQDVWAFRGPLKKIQGDFPVGVPRCDNRILYELKRTGYEVINPSFSVRAYHLHSGIRQEYSGENLAYTVDPPYAYLWPHNLWSLPRTILYNLRYPNARLSWRFDQRKFASSLPVRSAKKVWRMLKSWLGGVSGSEVP